MDITELSSRGLSVCHLTLTGQALVQYGYYETDVEAVIRDQLDLNNVYYEAEQNWRERNGGLADEPEIPLDWDLEPTTTEFVNPDGTQAYFVTVYDFGRGYGGPEEGGWWFDTGQPIEHRICRSYDEACELRDELRNGEYARTGNAYSVLPGEDYVVGVGLRPGEAFPKETPRYE